jgi:uncharacterized membrane protein YfcA
MLEIPTIAILIAVCSLTYSFEIVFGLAGTILMLPILSFFYDSKTLVIYSILPQLLVAGIALSKSIQKTDFRELLEMMLFAVFGGILGGFVFVHIPHDVFKRLLAAVIILAGIFMITSPRFRIGKIGRHALSFSAGISHALFGICGPIVMTRLLGTFDDKTVIRNTALMFFVSINFVRGGFYLLNRSITPELWRMFFYSVLILVPVLFFADKLHFKLNDSVFKKTVSWIILFSGFVYLFN